MSAEIPKGSCNISCAQRGVPAVLRQTGKCVERQGSVLQQSLLSIFFPEFDDRENKEALIFNVYGIAGLLVE